MRLHVEFAQRAAAGIRDEARVGIDLADLRVPQAPEFEEALLLPFDIGAARRILRIGGARQVQAGGVAEIRAGNARSSTCR